MRKVWLWLVGIVIALLGMLVGQWPRENVRVIMCDVGQGDAILITKGFNQILVDGGPNNGKAMNCIGKYIPFWDREIELVVATHPENDHLGGLKEIIERYAVGTVLTSDAGKATETFSGFYKAVRESSAKLTIADRGMILNLGEISMRVISPVKDNGLLNQWYQNRSFIDKQVLGDVQEKLKLNVNKQGVVLLLTYKANKVLLTGDIDQEVEEKLVEAKLIPNVDILKAAHHGSKTSTGQTFLEAARPKLTLISVGEKNSYGHPSKEVIERLELIESQIKRTDQVGDIVIELK